MKDFFVSYNKADRSWAEWIAWQLEAAGYTVVVQAWDFRPGGNFVLDMQRATSEAQRTIAVLSPDYLDSRFTQPEWAAAFKQDPTSEQGLLLPVRVRECEPQGLLPQIVYVDLVGLSEDAAEQQLLAGVKRERAKPKTEPSFPGTVAKPRTIADRPRFPNALPSIWNVPHSRNPNFTGRGELLAQIEAALRSGTPAALTQALSGLGGVGKTQLAVEYAYRHAADYDLVWWIRSEQPTTLAADYARLAQELNLSEKDATEQAAIIEAVQHWLERNGRWLLIFDNANEPPDVQPYRPRGGSGHVLITSRYRDWRGTAQPLTVTKLPRDQAVEFLLKRTGQSDTEAAAKLADELDGLPLALEQASAYIGATSISLAEYLNLFQTYQVALFDEQPPSDDYPRSITKTWELAFEQIQQQAPAAIDLLNLCAFLAPDNIPLSIIRDGAEYLPEELAAAVQNPLVLNRAIGALLRYSLVERQDDMLSVHRMVQAVTRDRLNDEGRKLWAGAAVEVVNAAFPIESYDVRTWDQCARLLFHSLSSLGYARRLVIEPTTTARLLNQIGLYLRERGEFVEARKVHEQSLMIVEQMYGPTNPLVAISLNNLAHVLEDMGEIVSARVALRRALMIDKHQYGLKHPTFALRLSNFGVLLRRAGEWRKALIVFNQAIAIYQEEYGLEHIKTATIYNNLGLVLLDMGEFAEAKRLFSRVLAIAEKEYGREHPNVASTVNSIGGVLWMMGNLAEARKLFERALAIFHQFFGDEHPKTKGVRENLELLIREQQEQEQ